jgi:ABC-type nitrate/sulfonate/bicarbonate transport system substrate-binding protein
MSNIPATLALGLRSTPQSLGVIGKALGIFSDEGVDLQVVRQETAGPEGLRGLVQGEYMFAEFGAVPVVQAAFNGLDPLILLAAEPVSALYILGRCGISEPAALAGGCVGVLSRAGQTGYSAERMLERWGLAGQAELLPLGTYPAIYEGLARGSIDAGVLTADYRLAGEIAHGLKALADLGEYFGFQGPVVVTTRRLRNELPELVHRVVRAYSRTVRAFAQQPEGVVPILQAHLGFVDSEQARAIHAFYSKRFSVPPRASDDGIARVILSVAESRGVPPDLPVERVHEPSIVEATYTKDD